MSTDITQNLDLQPGVDPQQLAQWMTANIFQQKYAAEKAYIEKTLPGTSIPDMIPFGSTVVINQSPTSNSAPATQAVIPQNTTTVPSSPEIVATNAVPINTSGSSVATPSVNTQPSNLNKLVQAAAIGIGLAGGSLGLASFLKQPNTTTTVPVVTQPQTVTPTNPVVVTPTDPIVNPTDPAAQYIEGILEWEFDSEKGLNIKQNDSNSNGVKPSTNRYSPAKTDTIAGRINH